MAKAKYPTREELLEVFELRVDSDGREELWRKSYQSKRGLEEEKIVENKANSDNDY